MIIDANVLLHAINARSAQHDGVRAWFHQVLQGPSIVGIPWIATVAYIRISTHPRIMPRPLSTGRAVEDMSAILRHPNVTTPTPGPRHLEIMERLLNDAGSAGNLVNDAHIAALAIEQGWPVATLDRDFRRFGVEVVIPTA